MPAGSDPLMLRYSLEPFGLLVRVMVTLSTCVSVSVISTSTSAIDTAAPFFSKTVAKSLPPVLDASKSKTGATFGSSFKNELDPLASAIFALALGAESVIVIASSLSIVRSPLVVTDIVCDNVVVPVAKVIVPVLPFSLPPEIA